MNQPLDGKSERVTIVDLLTNQEVGAQPEICDFTEDLLAFEGSWGPVRLSPSPPTLVLFWLGRLGSVYFSTFSDLPCQQPTSTLKMRHSTRQRPMKVWFDEAQTYAEPPPPKKSKKKHVESLEIHAAVDSAPSAVKVLASQPTAQFSPTIEVP